MRHLFKIFAFLFCTALAFAQSVPIKNATLQGTLNGTPTGGTLNLGSVTVSLGFTDGSTSAPGIKFSSDTDTGFYRIGANNLGITAGNTIVGAWSTTGLSLGSPIATAVGSAASPILTFGGTGDGFYTPADNQIGIGIGGNSVAVMSASTLTLGTNVALAFDGTGAATTATNLGLGTASSPQFTGIELGHATDTTITRGAAGRIAVEGVNVVTTSSTDTLTNKTLTSPTLTTPVITNINPGANFTLTNNGVSVLTSKNTGAVVNTLVLDNGSVGIGTSSPTYTGGNKLHVYESTAASIRATVEAGNTGYNSAIRLISAKDWFIQSCGTLGGSIASELAFIQNTDSITPLILSSTWGLKLTKTITAAATTGAQTINKTSGSVNFAAAATSLVVTNSMCATSSVIHCTIATNDATAANVKAVAGAGSFTIYLTTAPTAETRVNFLLTN